MEIYIFKLMVSNVVKIVYVIYNITAWIYTHNVSAVKQR
jgi:hypothetical protein